MKCMKNPTTNEVKRLNETRAKELAAKGWRYVPKSEWKASEGTSWRKNAEKAKPMSDSEKRRREIRDYRPEVAETKSVTKNKK